MACAPYIRVIDSYGKKQDFPPNTFTLTSEYPFVLISFSSTWPMISNDWVIQVLLQSLKCYQRLCVHNSLRQLSLTPGIHTRGDKGLPQIPSKSLNLYSRFPVSSIFDIRKYFNTFEPTNTPHNLIYLNCIIFKVCCSREGRLSLFSLSLELKIADLPHC